MVIGARGFTYKIHTFFMTVVFEVPAYSNDKLINVHMVPR